MAGQQMRLTSPEPSRLIPLTVVVLAVVGAALTALVWGLGQPFTVTVDGTAHTVQPGTTIDQLSGSGFTRAKPGSIYTIHGGIASLRGGSAVTFLRNGEQVPESQRVFPGDVIESVDGPSSTEHVVSVKVSIDPTATIQGNGPILKVVQAGRPGMELVRKGAISGEIVSKRTLVPAESIVLQASSPASGAKLVALTFDDGPWPDQTLKIIGILKQEGVPGTFFELGVQVKKLPQVSAAVVQAGNVVGNHSWSHPFLTKLKPAAVLKQITSAASAIKSATGTSPVVFRPPYGAIDHDVWVQSKAAGEAIALWNVDSLDWTRPGVGKIVNNVTSEMGRASIVLMHDGGGERSQTIAALPSVIHWLKARGYVFLTVPQLQAAR